MEAVVAGMSTASRRCLGEAGLHLGVQRSHPDRGAPPLTARLQRLGPVRARVDEQPARVEEPAHRLLGRADQVPALLEHLGDLGRAEAADQRHVEEHKRGRRQISQIDLLPAREQVPVDPRRRDAQAREQLRRRAPGRRTLQRLQHILAGRWLQLLQRSVHRLVTDQAQRLQLCGSAVARRVPAERLAEALYDAVAWTGSEDAPRLQRGRKADSEVDVVDRGLDVRYLRRRVAEDPVVVGGCAHGRGRLRPAPAKVLSTVRER